MGADQADIVESGFLSGLARFLRTNGIEHARMLFIFSIVVNLCALAPSFHMMQVYDRVLSSRSEGTLIAITAIVLFLLCVFVVAETVRGKISQRLSAVYAVSVSRKLFARLGDPTAANRAAAYLRDFASARQFFASRTFVSLFDLPFVPVYMLLLFFVHPTICLLTLGGLAIMTAAGYLNFSLSGLGREASRKTEGEAVGFAQSAFARSGEVRALGMVPNLLNMWGQRMAEALVSAEKATAVSSALYAASKGIRQAIQVITMAWGAFLVLEGDMSGGLIFLASMISGRALAPIEQAIGGWETIVRSIEAFNNVEELTGADKGLQRRPDLPEPKGHLQARNLVFRDYGRRPVLSGASIDVPPGTSMIINGEPGAGKSVLISILAGARLPEYGVVTLDGAPRERWPQSQWGRSIGYCGEEAGLLTGTVAQNISRFEPDGNLEEVYRVSMLLGLHDLVMELPQGYQTVISNSADHIPASARKQIALARAFYGSPKIILLDQPTTFLDSRREGALLNAISEALSNAAAIVMATQSPMMLRVANRAVAVRDGLVVASELPKQGQVVRAPENRTGFASPAQTKSEMAS